MKRTWASLLLLIFVLTLSAIIPPEYASMPLATDPDLVQGTLPNGLKYYIMRNAKPEKRIELRLLVDAGSVEEDDDQLGLAHFTEHMAFNGSKNFPRTEMVQYLSSIGMGFHNGLNGGTSYDRTIYQFKLPTDNEAQMRKGISILSDIAWQLDMATDEVERERGIIMEEWRLGQSAQQRIDDQIDKVRMAGSRYEVRNPIGTKENLKTFKPESLRRFYQDWYRPDLQTVIIVGDYDPAQLEALVKEFFGVIPPRQNPRPKQIYKVPDNLEPRAISVQDKELPYSMLQATWKMENTPTVDLGTFYNELKQDLFYSMFNARMQEISMQPEPPFSYAWGFNQYWLKWFKGSIFAAISAEGRSEDAYRVLLTELTRIKQHGFQPGEFERAKLELIRMAETQVAEKPTIDSNEKIWGLLFSVFDGDTYLSPESYDEMLKGMIGEIGLQEVNDIIDDVITPENLTLSLSGTEKEGAKYLSTAELLTIFNEIKLAQVTPYEDKTVDEPIMDKIPAPQKITHESVSASGIKKWKLANGVTVYSKKTDFKADEVLLSANSPGGLAALNAKDYKAGELLPSYFSASGFGNFDATSLQKALVGKVVYVYPSLETYSENWSGSCSPKDMELMFQLVHQYSTVPRFDDNSFSAAVSRLRSFVQNSLLDPENAFFDTLDVLTYNNHPLKRDLRPEDLDKTTLQQVERVFRDRFGDYSDFTFYVVGNFDEELLKTYCSTYLGNLPTMKRKDKIRNARINAFAGKKEIRYHKGSERSFVSNISMCKADLSAASSVSNSALMVLAYEKLRENVRENLSGVYSISIWNRFERYPKPKYKVQTWMGCDPEKADFLNQATFTTLDSLRNGLFEDKYVQTAKSTLTKRYEENIKSNRYWVTNMSSNVFNGAIIDGFLSYPELYDKLDKKTLTAAAKKYLSFNDNRLSVFMFPLK